MITKENAKDWLPLVQALAEGKRVQKYWFKSKGGGDWHDERNISDSIDPREWRIAPEPRKVPLTAEDIPAVCWVRWITGAAHLVTAVSEDALFAGEEWSLFNQLQIDLAEYSTDRKTWLPCWKEVAE